MAASNRRWTAIILIAFAAILILIQHQSLRAEPSGIRQRWQYASLMTSPRLSKWTSPDAQRTEEGDQGYLHLYTDMGGTKPADKVSLIDLLNLLGNQGWELVAIDGGEGPHQYLFKRLAE
jgi:hypothetical protein